ncbi:MAG: adenosine deaminase [Candidatus Solibacter usitatus]|nr:adenosine deaminase [Candidatus Solibacter usitatus]
MTVRTHELDKAELHVHLEGSIEAETMSLIAPSLSREEIAARYSFNSFEQFLKNFGWVTMHLSTPEHYGMAATALVRKLESQNVRYAEITLSAGVALRRGQDLQAIHRAVMDAAAASSVKTAWIWDAVRQWGVEAAERVVDAAIEHASQGVVAFGLGGDEANGPASQFLHVFQRARDAGLRLVCHAGEITAADSVRQALDCGAERIGHGIRAVNDVALLRRLARENIPLEISISSNVLLRAVPDLPSHPIRRIYDAGVPVVLNTDDPAMFGVTLIGEYELAARAFGFSEVEMRGLAANGFRYAFAWL